MTFAGTAPQSTSKATSVAKLSSAIICRVPDIEAIRASMGLTGRTPTQHDTARIIRHRANGGKSFDRGNIV